MWLPLQLLNALIFGASLWLAAKFAFGSFPLPSRLLLALPLLIPMSAAGLALTHPPDEDDGDDGLWRFTPLGMKLNPSHPAARRLLRSWAVLAAIWLLALDESVRHDFSRMFGR